MSTSGAKLRGPPGVALGFRFVLACRRTGPKSGPPKALSKKPGNLSGDSTEDSWEVPHDMKKGGRPSFFVFGSLLRGGGYGGGGVQGLYAASAGPSQSDIAQGEQLEAAMENYRTCPQCGSQDFRDERAKRPRSST